MISSTPKAPPRKPLLRFAAHALLLALLIGYWPTLRAVYPEFFRAQARAVYGSGEGASVRLGPPPSDRFAQDSVMEGREPGNPEPLWRVEFSAVTLGYWPSAVFVALLLATPMLARSRFRAALIGLLWLDLFALGRLGLGVWLGFEEYAQGPGGEAVGGRLLLRTGHEVLNSNIVVIASVLLAWVILASPREKLLLGGLRGLLGPGSGGTPPANS